MIIVIAFGCVFLMCIVVILLNQSLHDNYLKDLKKLIDYNKKVLKELKGCINENFQKKT